MSLVSFFIADVKPIIKNKTVLKKFIPFIFTNEKKNLKRLSLILCSDNYLLALNQRYLNHDFYTDILTFDLSEDENVVGEIYISIDRIREIVRLMKLHFPMKFERVIIHGSLHLCGYLDKKINEKKVMTFLEDFYLQKLSSFHVKQK